MNQTLPQTPILPAEAGHTVAKVLRSRLYESQPSWKQVRALIEQRRVRIDSILCTDSGRRLKEGELLELLANPVHMPKTVTPDGLVIRHLDEHVVVVEKTSGINTVRHPLELSWKLERRRLDPTLEDVTQWAIAEKLSVKSLSLPPLRIVHRLDKETSGLVCFARSRKGEVGLGQQFRAHTVVRRYIAVVRGEVKPQTFRSNLIKDRGDGRRGSTTLQNVGKHAVTHVSVEARHGPFTMLSCRLETGRTHQIRIHLSESGHPVCGDKVYHHKPDGTMMLDTSNASRLVLHAIELGFEHPVTGTTLHWEMPLPRDLERFVERISRP